MNELKSTKNQIISVEINNEKYEIPIDFVINSIGEENIKKFQNKPFGLKGVLSFKGEIFPEKNENSTSSHSEKVNFEINLTNEKVFNDKEKRHLSEILSTAKENYNFKENYY